MYTALKRFSLPIILRKFLLPLFMLSWLAGCEPAAPIGETGHESQYVVNSYLEANKLLPQVLLSTTGPADKEYNAQENSVRDARVQIRLLKEDGTIDERYPYRHITLGRYLPGKPAPVLPGRRYQLLVAFDNGDTLQSETRVPEAFRAIGATARNYQYQQDPQVEVWVTPSNYPGRQTYYMFTIESQDHEADDLVPFYQDMVTEKGIELQDYYMNSTDITGALNYHTDEDDNLLLNIPWSGFVFYGNNRITINAIDDNIYHTWPSISPGLMTEGMTMSPERNEQLSDHISGGLGIFGSMSSVSVDVKIRRSERP